MQFKKHSSEIVSNISGNITSESELHPAKSFLLSSFILPEKTISFKDSQLENASLSTLDILSGRWSDFKFIQSENPRYGIDLTFLGIYTFSTLLFTQLTALFIINRFFKLSGSSAKKSSFKFPCKSSKIGIVFLLI